jgi:hypothetical protein
MPMSLDANRRLATLLGWTNIIDVGGALLGRPPGGSPASRDQARIPDWTGDWRDCGPLLVEHVHLLEIWSHRLIVGATRGFDLMSDRGEGDEAIMRAIGDGVIAKLEGR